MQSVITHPATIIKVGKDRILARVEVKSACGSCAARGACGISDCADKTIEITNNSANSYKIGDKITVTLGADYGFYALFLGYLLPLILVLLVLFGALALGASEIRSGIYAIIVLIPYYFALSLGHKHLQKKFVFKIGDK